MKEPNEESFRATTRAVLSAIASSESVERLRFAVDESLQAAIVRAYPHLGLEQAYDLAFHLSDWREDGAFLIALALAPERFTVEEAAAGLEAFLIHAPNHIAAAAKLAGWPVADIFEVGALDAAREHPPGAD